MSEIISSDEGLTAEDKELERQITIEKFKQLKGIGEGKAIKLIDAGYHSLEQIAMADPRDFSANTGMSKSASEQLIAEAGSLMDLGKPVTLGELSETEESEKGKYLTTGSTEFDELIDGGYHRKMITEIQALNGAGKTQASITASVWATQPEEVGGLDGYVVYIDAENTFRARRAKEISDALGFDWDTVANRIIVIRANTSAEQIKLMDKVNEIAGQKPVRLLVVDSIISHFRNEYIGRGALAERQQLLNRYLGVLHNFAIANDSVVLITNQMMDSPDGFAFGPSHIAVGGNCLGHACPYRIQIRKGMKGKRIVRLVKAPDLPEGEACVTINEKGVTNE